MFTKENKAFSQENRKRTLKEMRARAHFAIPIKRALFILRNQKQNQLHELETLTTEVLTYYDTKIESDHTQEGYQFILFPKKKQFETNMSNKISNSTKSVKVITSWKRYVKSLNVFEETVKKALKNGVMFQVLVTEKPQEYNFLKAEKFFQDHPKTVVKFVDSLTETIEIIIDDKEIFLITEPEADLTESPALWSNNSSLVAALLTYFNSIWKETSQ